MPYEAIFNVLEGLSIVRMIAIYHAAIDEFTLPLLPSDNAVTVHLIWV
jgi:hypothetical protein